MSGIRHHARIAVIAAVAVSPVPVRAESVLTTLISTDIRGLMPGVSPDVSTGTVLQNIYEGLVAWRGDGTVGLMLAEQVTTSADGRTYSFTLRPDIRFQNGAPLTSREVAGSNSSTRSATGRAARISTGRGKSISPRSRWLTRCMSISPWKSRAGRF